MQRQGRNNSAGAANGGGNDGRRGGFPDPFAGFGAFGGFGFGPSMMEDMFNRDPFDDPFFTRPFGSFFGNGGIFQGDNFFGSRPEGGFLEQRPFNPQQESRRGPIIEEIDGDHPDTSSRPRSSQEPIVEHPDDDVKPDRNRQSRNMTRQGPMVNQQGNNGVRSYSFQSSSISYGGPNGNYYTSSTSRRAGPNGVVHEEHFEKDSASGQESERVSRGIQDKGHSVTRKRNAEGREGRVETLHNLAEDEVSQFEKRWETEAERSLPGWNRNRARALAGNGSNTGSRQRAALPSSGGGGGGSSGWSGARHA